MLLDVGADAANGSDRVFLAAAALQAGSELPATQQEADRRNVARLLSLPHSASWSGDCLVRLDPGWPPGFSYLACAAARAAARAEARCWRRPAGGQRPIPRSINASIVRRSVGGERCELGVPRPIRLSCGDTATRLGVRTGGGRRLSDRPSHPAERQRLRRRGNREVCRGSAASWPLGLVIVAQFRCGPIAANRRSPSTCGSVDRPGPRSPSPNADPTAAGTKEPGVVQWT